MTRETEYNKLIQYFRSTPTDIFFKKTLSSSITYAANKTAQRSGDQLLGSICQLALSHGSIMQSAHHHITSANSTGYHTAYNINTAQHSTTQHRHNADTTLT